MTTDTGNFTSRRHYFTDRFADRQYRERFAHANIAQGVAAQIRAVARRIGRTPHLSCDKALSGKRSLKSGEVF